MLIFLVQICEETPRQPFRPQSSLACPRCICSQGLTDVHIVRRPHHRLSSWWHSHFVRRCSGASLNASSQLFSNMGCGGLRSWRPGLTWNPAGSLRSPHQFVGDRYKERRRQWTSGDRRYYCLSGKEKPKTSSESCFDEGRGDCHNLRSQ